MRLGIFIQEAQLPQRNSASAAHVEGVLGSPANPLCPLWLTPMHMVEFETRKKNVRQAH